MGLRGPKPEPAAVKQMKGNPGNRPIGTEPAAAVKAEASMPAPSWLKGEGLTVWKRLAPRLVAMNILRPLDTETFGRYCRNFANWLMMQKRLDDEGWTYDVDSEHGKYKRAHPAYLIADRLERQLIAAEANFGLNPAERQRLFAARAALGAQGLLFDDPDAKKPGTMPPPASSPVPGNHKPSSVVGLLAN